MKVCGIIAEYNPFHNGHLRHFALTREALGADTLLICAMSGAFVQRGEPAILDKHTRAEMAVRCGADLVLELPLPWAMAPAETFARGAVGLLAATGLVEALSFGSEDGDLAALCRTAELLDRDALRTPLRNALDEGLPFARARQRAAETLAGAPLPHLTRPNSILGIEYLRAIRALAPGITPLAVRREGAGHDETGGSDCPSGMELRRRLTEGAEIGTGMPPPARAVLERVLREAGPPSPRLLETALLSRLRFLSREDYTRLPDLSEGLENRLFDAASAAPSLAAALEAAGAKRYPAARLRRLFWAAALGLRREDSLGGPPYLRPLAAGVRGRELLARMRKTAALPVLTKPAAVHSLGGRAERVFRLEAGAADLLALGHERPEPRRGGRDWLAHPVLIDISES